jgi:GTPase SAR1 family protein
MDKKPTKVYRFALYGLSASGKTCLLAALAMPRYPHPLNYTSTWRPIDVSDSTKDKQEALRHSREWLKESIDRLSRRDVPEPNPTGEEHFIFEYDFTGTDYQTFRIELFDYSGELVNPNISDSELAKTLRQKFSEMDGILVLAEAPYQDQLGHVSGHQKTRDGQAHKDLYDLRQTFSLLRGEKQEGAALDTPVALLINKWDRYSHIGSAHPDIKQDNIKQNKLKGFLKLLLLKKSEKDSRIDSAHPDIEQDKLDGFFKSVDSRPHKGLNDVLQHSVTEGNFKAFPVSALGAGEFVRLENGDVVERPKQVQPLNAFGLEDPFLWLVQRRDAIDLRHYQNNALSNLKQCQQNGKTLLNRFLPDSAQAKQVKKVLGRCRRRGFYYATGTVASVLALWLTAETTMDVWNYKKITTAIENPNATYDQFIKAEEWLTKYTTAPYFRHLISQRFIKSDDVKTTLINLQTRLPEIQKIEAAFRKQQQENWNRFKAGYDDKMRRKNFLAAAQVLNNRQSDERLEKLKTEFKGVVIQRIEDEVERAFKDYRLRDAQDILGKYAQFPPELQYPPGSEGDHKIKVLRYQVAERQDQALYEEARTYSDRDHILNYLQNAPLQTMETEVSEYKAYLDSIEPSATIFNLTLFVRITWLAAAAKGNDNVVNVSLDGRNVISETNVESAFNQSTVFISSPFSAKPSDLKTVAITVIEEDLFSDDDNGSGNVKKKVSDLAKGYTLKLHAEGKTTAKTFIQILGYPKAPDLPAWHAEK